MLNEAENYYVTKRDGSKQELRVEEIRKKLKAAGKSKLTGEQYLEIESKLRAFIFNGIKTTQIHSALYKCVADLIQVDTPGVDYVAANLVLQDIYHRSKKVLNKTVNMDLKHIDHNNLVFSSEAFLSYLHFMKKHNKLAKCLVNTQESELKEIFTLCSERKIFFSDFDSFTYSGIITLNTSYLQRYEDEVIELPQWRFMLIAMHLSRIFLDNLVLPKNLSHLNFSKLAVEFYHLLSTKKFMVATPTLKSGGINNGQLSSCFLTSMDDSIEGIFDIITEAAIYSKNGGGVSVDLSDIRSKGSYVRGVKSASNGIIAWSKLLNDVSVYVDQLGARKGAISLYLGVWHYDILQFLDLRKNSGEERERARDIFPAVVVPDKFMEAVQDDSTWYLFDPYQVRSFLSKTKYHGKTLTNTHNEEFNELFDYLVDNNVYSKTIGARELYTRIIRSYFETGLPFWMFKDSCNRYSNFNNTINSSNLCTEILQPTISNKYKLETEPILYNRIYEYGETAICNLGSINMLNCKLEDLKNVIPFAVMILSSVVVGNTYVSIQTKKSADKYRSIGVGMMNEHAAIVDKKIRYGSEEHKEFIDKYYKEFTERCLLASSDIAETNTKIDIPDDCLARWCSNEARSEELKERIKSVGLFNAVVTAVAPTNSISVISGCTQSIDPIFNRIFLLDSQSSIKYLPVLAPNLSLDNWELYTPAYEINPLKIIELSNIRNKYIDQAVSVTLFIDPSKTYSLNDEQVSSGKIISTAIMNAWKGGTKTLYYLRSKSKDNEEEYDDAISCSGCQ